MYDDDYDEYEEYERPPQRPRLRRPVQQWFVWNPRRPGHLKLAAIALLAVIVLCWRGCGRGYERPGTPPPKKQTVKVISWSEIDSRVHAASISAYDAAVRHAEEKVRRWKDLLKERQQEFLDWYFSFFTVNSLEMRSIGYALADTALVEFFAGDQPSARERIGEIVSEAYAARVLHPASAQLKVESICRSSVEVYLTSLSHQLSGLQAEFEVPQAEWDRYLAGASELALGIDGRQVLFATKAMLAGGGVAVTKVVSLGGRQLQGLTVRAGGKLAAGARVGSKFVRGAAWYLGIGLVAWDLYDHRRTVQENRPVLERALNGYLDELEQQVLHDSESGIIQVLDGVQYDVLQRLETTEAK